MRRNIFSQLIKWKNGTNRKPLIINGARQVGKTYILKEFGCTQYKNTAYVNCDNNNTVPYFKNTLVATTIVEGEK